jgi:hypothetical protein
MNKQSKKTAARPYQKKQVEPLKLGPVQRCQSEPEFIDAVRGPLPPEAASRKQHIGALM